MPRPTSFEPVNETKRVCGCSTRRRRCARRRRDEVQDTGRHADFAQQLHELRGDAGSVTRGLQHHGVAAHERGGRHAHHDRNGEIPRRDDDADTERNVDQFVVFAGHRRDRLLRRVAQHLAPVELHEVDGLGGVGIGLGPALADFVDHPGVVFESMLPQNIGRTEQEMGALLGRHSLPRMKHLISDVDGLVGLLGEFRSGKCR